MKSEMEIRPYLYVAVKNTALNKIKVNRRTSDVEESTMNPLFVEHRDASDDYEYQQLEQVIMTAIEALPPKCREVFRLSRFEDKSYKEIAATLDISLKTVENQMGKAIKRLREAHEKYKSLGLMLLLVLFFGGT